MPVYLGMLALQARTGPASNICIDARPDKVSRDEALCCSNPRVREGMKGVKN